MLNTQIQQIKAAMVNFLIVVVISAVIGGCTTGRILDLTGSTTNVDTPSQQDEPVLMAEKEQTQASDAIAGSDKINPESKPVSTEQINNASVHKIQTIKPVQPQMSSLVMNSEMSASDSAALAYAATLAEVPNKELLAQERIDIINSQMAHSTCNGGWAKAPDKLDASRVTPGHPYYMEIRLRHTPLLPVGHTYVAYGRLSPEGRPLNEHLIMLSPLGGYGGAAVAAAVPMPGILTPVIDDCRIKPLAAYRITLTAQQYELLILRIQKMQKKIPAYALFVYNCNHFAADIVASVGILPAKNKYLPALKYIYSMIEANEGQG